MADIFTEKTLREEIVKTWGPAGVHVEVYDILLEKLAELKKENATLKQVKKECEHDWVSSVAYKGAQHCGKCGKYK